MKATRFLCLTAIAYAALVAGPASAECAFPKAPQTVPNGSTATEAEMVASMSQFKAYQAEVQAFGSCLEAEAKDKNAGGLQAKALLSKKVATANEELESKAKAFNEQVRIFKARSG